MNSIYLAVVVNHATQCELIIFYVHEIKTRLEEKSITLKDAMPVLRKPSTHLILFFVINSLIFLV